MKPFNLQDAIAGKPIVTREGKPVEFIAYVPKTDSDYKVIVLINKQIYSYTTTVKPTNSQVTISPIYLIMAPQNKHYWVNLYAYFHMSTWYNSQKEADQEAACDRLGNKAFLLK